MNDLVEAILQADDLIIGDLLTAVLQRYAVLFPDWEVSTFSVEKNVDRNKQIDSMIEILESLKKTS